MNRTTFILALMLIASVVFIGGSVPGGIPGLDAGIFAEGATP